MCVGEQYVYTITKPIILACVTLFALGFNGCNGCILIVIYSSTGFDGCIGCKNRVALVAKGDAWLQWL